MKRLTPAMPLALFLTCTVAGCAGDSSTDDAAPDTTTLSERTDHPSATVQTLLDEWAGDGRGGAAAAVAGDDAHLVVTAAGRAGSGEGLLEPESEFRVGSIAKTFVSVMVLQLVDEGTVGLEDLVVDHAPELTIAEGVTIRQLLAHRTGIPEHTDGELAPELLADPNRTWTPTEVLDLVADQPRDFSPGEQFAYSNSNYLVAGLLLEAVTGSGLGENLDTRIVEPLELTGTYFAPDDTRAPIGGFSASLPGGDTAGTSYRGLETAAGAAGALVSTAGDLAVFVRALAHRELLSDATYAEMTAGLPEVGHSLGLFPAEPPSTTGISNGGAIPGFLSFMQYDPATENLVVLLLNDDTRSPDPLGNELEQVAADL
jgi:D-alanyl-D-alanine carboxypeptidase